MINFGTFNLHQRAISLIDSNSHRLIRLRSNLRLCYISGRSLITSVISRYATLPRGRGEWQEWTGNRSTSSDKRAATPVEKRVAFYIDKRAAVDCRGKKNRADVRWHFPPRLSDRSISTNENRDTLLGRCATAIFRTSLIFYSFAPFART